MISAHCQMPKPIGHSAVDSALLEAHATALPPCLMRTDYSVVQEVLDATATTSMRGAQRGVGRKWYFEKLDLHGIRCNLTLVPHGGFREWDTGGAVAAATRYRVASTLGINIIEINSVPLRVNALQLKNAFVTPRALLSQLMRHLFFQVRGPRNMV